MKVYGEDIPDSKVVEKILRTMPMKFDHVVTTIIESHDTDIMTVAELQGSIESHVSRILEKTEKVNEEALKSQVNLNNIDETNQSVESRGRDNYNNGGRGNYRGRGRGNNYQQRANFNCLYCGKFGHKATECRFKQQANVAESHQNIGENSYNPQSLFLASNTFSEGENIWYLDTGCSNHMCGKKELLQ
uniref:CCHC-type domain-containing protein n=1 Tax=Cajanus cajan TaxID=3821 RepID=A0A151RQW0_CAJCA|nr:hypothetical protein KK1_033561 [Cajanus cajan]